MEDGERDGLIGDIGMVIVLGMLTFRIGFDKVDRRKVYKIIKEKVK